VTFGSCIRASTARTPPGGGWKSSRAVSTRPDVHAPAESRSAVMRRLPSRWTTFAVLSVLYSISPVPQFGGPPGICVPMR
jgi:hypothetical protein